VEEIGQPDGKGEQDQRPHSDPNRGVFAITDSKTHTPYPQLITLKRKGRQPASFGNRLAALADAEIIVLT
jgi:hypothetical protein